MPQVQLQPSHTSIYCSSEQRLSYISVTTWTDFAFLYLILKEEFKFDVVIRIQEALLLNVNHIIT